MFANIGSTLFKVSVIAAAMETTIAVKFDAPEFKCAAGFVSSVRAAPLPNSNNGKLHFLRVRGGSVQNDCLTDSDRQCGFVTKEETPFDLSKVQIDSQDDFRSILTSVGWEQSYIDSTIANALGPDHCKTFDVNFMSFSVPTDHENEIFFRADWDGVKRFVSKVYPREIAVKLNAQIDILKIPELTAHAVKTQAIETKNPAALQCVQELRALTSNANNDNSDLIKKGFQCIKLLHAKNVSNWGSYVYHKIVKEFYPVQNGRPIMPSATGRADLKIFDEQALVAYEQLEMQFGSLYAARILLEWKVGCNAEFRGDGVVKGSGKPEYLVLNDHLVGKSANTIKYIELGKTLPKSATDNNNKNNNNNKTKNENNKTTARASSASIGLHHTFNKSNALIGAEFLTKRQAAHKSKEKNAKHNDDATIIRSKWPAVVQRMTDVIKQDLPKLPATKRQSQIVRYAAETERLSTVVLNASKQMAQYHRPTLIAMATEKINQVQEYEKLSEQQQQQQQHRKSGGGFERFAKSRSCCVR